MIEEIWKKIPNYDNYEVSSLGNIISNRKLGNGYNGRTAEKYHPINSIVDKTGYAHFYISGNNSKRKSVLLHRIILQSFVGECPDGQEACHNDGDRLNNKISNLRWDTRSRNTLDQVKHGTHGNIAKHGRIHLTSKLSPEKVIEIRKKFSNGARIRDISREYGIGESNAWSIKNNKTWKFLINKSG